MLDLEGHTRVYTRTGKRAHYLRFNESPNLEISQAVCDVSRTPFELWLGTGSQKEIDRAEKLPLCINCAKWVKDFFGLEVN